MFNYKLGRKIIFTPTPKSLVWGFTIISILTLLVSPLFSDSQVDTIDTAHLRKLIVFYSPVCHRCSQIKNEVLPEIEKAFKDKIRIEYVDISELQNYKLLLGLQEKYGVKMKNTLPVFYLEGNFFNGEGPVREGIIQLITKTLNKTTREKLDIPRVDLIKHFKGFQLFAVISAGLIDGINPCAFTVIVFFMSFLALQGYKKRELLIIGLSFIFAVFLTYFLIGLGLFGFLYRLKGLWLVARLVNFSIGVFSIILGILCLSDFYKFKRTKEAQGMILQLPPAVKNQIRKLIGFHYRINRAGIKEGKILSRGVFQLFLTALITGFLISLLEAVCTGQVYLPTIAFVLKTTPLKLQALGYLLLYNSMFSLPLLVIFLFALFGATSEQFSLFLKRHLLIIKILMAVIFFVLGIFLIRQA